MFNLIFVLIIGNLNSFADEMWLKCNPAGEKIEAKALSFNCNSTKKSNLCVYKDIECEHRGRTPRSIGAAVEMGSFESDFEEMYGYFLAGFTYDFICEREKGKCPTLDKCIKAELSKASILYLDARSDDAILPVEVNTDKGAKSVN